jgi:hypothetical protein
MSATAATSKSNVASLPLRENEHLSPILGYLPRPDQATWDADVGSSFVGRHPEWGAHVVRALHHSPLERWNEGFYRTSSLVHVLRPTTPCGHLKCWDARREWEGEPSHSVVTSRLWSLQLRIDNHRAGVRAGLEVRTRHLTVAVRVRAAEDTVAVDG